MDVYLQVLDNAKWLPEKLFATGSEASTFRNTGLSKGDPFAFDGWVLCTLMYKMNQDGPEWWSNQTDVAVSTSGDLFEFHHSEEFDGKQRESHSRITPVDDAHLKMWDENGWGFSKITDAITELI